jgi:hypothetical protein
MRLIRTSAAVSLGLLVALVPTADAAKKPAVKTVAKPVCNLITDNAKDTFAVRSQDGQGAYGPQEDALDILSMDVASDATNLTGVVRVAKLSTTAQSAPGGIDFRISFTLPGQDPTAGNFFLNARTTSAGVPSFLLGLRTVVAGGQSTTAKLVDGTGTFDTAKNEIHITVPVSAVKSGNAALAAGSIVSFAGLDQTSARQVAVNPATGVGSATFADVAASESTYKAGAKSCVTPGK